MATVQRHTEISDRFLEQAEREFRAGDLLQASEKAWGAVAHYVKSVAQEMGWLNSSHGDVNRNAKRLIRRTSDPNGYGRMLQAINALHINFYEENLDPDDVERSIQDARTLIDAMNSVRGS